MRTCPNCGTRLVDLTGGGASAAPGAPFSRELLAYWRGFRAGAVRLAAPSRYPRAPLGPRLIASLIDAVIGWIPLVPAGVVAAMGYAAANEAMMAVGTLTFLVAFAWALYYTLVRDGWGAGQSIGKRQVGLMVVHLQTRRPCTRAQSAIRGLVLLLTIVVLPGVGWLIEPVIVLVMQNGRRLGDHAADTQVIAVADHEQANDVEGMGNGSFET